MQDQIIEVPNHYQNIKEATTSLGFIMPSDLQTGSILGTLISSKTQGKFLELGTGTGLSLSWIVESMDMFSEVTSIDNDKTFSKVASDHLSADPRVTILCQDAGKWILENQDQKFDLIFADAWPGKYELLDETLNLLSVGGIYFIDDMTEQSEWPEGHKEKADNLLAYLTTRIDIKLTQMNWSTGLIIATKIK